MKSVSSFDIFDTCIIRKCGTPRNLFDILSHRVFSVEVDDESRVEFVTCRISADDTTTYRHLYDTFNFSHPYLFDKERIMQMELECERLMMTPVLTMLKEVNSCRNRGDHIIFISDMYLPTDFLKDALKTYGFFKENDSIYISGDCGYKKSDGALYKFIKDKESIQYNNWRHYGDNQISDIQVPKELGITTHLINHNYLPFEQLWINHSNNLSFHTGGIMAGIGRSINLSTKNTPHNAFAIDITAPLMTTFAMRIMTDAANRGIKRLFFCSRDCFALYHVAKKMCKVISSVEPIYFHTSRDALYNTNEKELIKYLHFIKIANNETKVGIVDIRSTGRSLQYINEVLERNGYNTIFGYYLEMYCSNYYIDGIPPYYCEVNRLYCDLFTHHHPILEKFFSLSTEDKTAGYKDNQYVLIDSSVDKDCIIKDIDKLSEINLNILCKYADYFIETELYRHCTEVFLSFVIPTLKHFFSNPYKEYLYSLKNLYVLQENGSLIPYIETATPKPIINFLRNRHNSKSKIVRFLTKKFEKLLQNKTPEKPVWWPEGNKVLNS